MTGKSSSRLRYRSVTLLGVCLLLVATVATTGCSPRELGGRAQGLINTERASRGLPQLAWDDNAAAKAQDWANQLAARKTLAHSRLTDGISGSWTALGENVGFSANVDAAHRGFMGSAKHRGNILNGGYTAVGVGVAQRDGLYYVVQVFRG